MAEDPVATLVSLTGASDAVAQQMLDMTDGDLEQAAALYFDNPDAFTAPAAAPSSTAPRLPEIPASGGFSGLPARPNSQSTRAGRQDTHGIIHIDSDDDDDGDARMADNDDFGFHDDGDATATAVAVAQTAQEEEDAAMAKRLQEELYAENASTSDGIRAPIARTTETLVEPSYGNPRDLDDGMGRESAVLEQIRRRQQASGRVNPFSQSQNAWARSDPFPDAASSASASQNSRAARLAELFKPPYDLMSHLTWDEARTRGREEKKWLLVNIQDMSDFHCQVLNRDLWKDDAVKSLVSENFIFLQYTKDDPEASQYIQYYLNEGRHENPDNYPHVAIVDPRTGEQVKVWSGRPFPDALEFHAQMVEFLERYSLAANSKNPVAKAKTRQPVSKDVGRMTEEEMLELALQNSLETAGGSSSRPNVHDPDELTASVGDAGKGKGRTEDDLIDLTETAPETSVESAVDSAFARIALDRPHVEPANDPATTTRIQFRHAGGRIIRRFAVDDQVVRIYEWLKASPLEGKEGLEFELKIIPQARDLLEDLDKTVADAGLKQATVMIEYIQP